MKKTKNWLQKHKSDYYVQQAQKAGYRSRAAFKLQQLQKKYKLIKPGMKLADLGAAPGGWSQVMMPILGEQGCVYAIDLLEMDPIPGVYFIQGDFTEMLVLTALLEKLEGNRLSGVFSDLSPNLSGIKSVDNPRAYYLAELAFDFCQQTLKPGGCFVIKIFQGSGFELFLKMIRNAFEKVSIEKPDASRNESREVYFVAQGFKGG